jgi:transposase
MPRYKPFDYSQMTMIPISLEKQIVEGTLEHTIHYMVEKKMDTTVFENRFKNDDTGSPAYHPKVLLKVILLSYSRCLVSSRAIERACRENVVFMALSGEQKPDHSTIAHFVSSMKREIIHLFRDILLVCEEMELLGGTHFSLDGLRLSSNASKEWSGTFKELQKKRAKLQKRLKEMVREHQRNDREREIPSTPQKKQMKRLEQKVEKLEKFLSENKPKAGKTKKEIQSNVTDNESAKMVTSHGVVQGYNAQALVDDKHQIILHGESFGNAQDHDNLKPMLDGAKENLQSIGKSEDYFKGTKFTSDSNYYDKKNLQICETQELDAYIPDQQFRKRDERYGEQKRFRGGVNRRAKRDDKDKTPRLEKFDNEDFTYEKEKGTYICPNGKVLNLKVRRHYIRNVVYRHYCSKEQDCRDCPFRKRCLAKATTKVRHLLIALEKSEQKNRDGTISITQRMKNKIDTPEGKAIYSRRLAIVEPVFANISCQKRLDKFTLRSKSRVDIQWTLYCMVHNIEKILHYGNTAKLLGMTG